MADHIQLENQYFINHKNSPIIISAIHDGHNIDPYLYQFLNLQEHERLREEDPYTGFIATLADVSQVVVSTSRFQTDLNRTKERSVYLHPTDAWGLDVWGKDIPLEIIHALNENYERFYADIDKLIRETIKQHGNFILLDLHSYNRRRESPFTAASDKENPEINIGTANNHEKWNVYTQQFIQFISKTIICNKNPDIRENVKFKGAAFSKWINSNYGDKGYVLSIEFKKTFMDEWTGRLDVDHLHDIKEAVKSSIPLLKSTLAHSKS